MLYFAAAAGTIRYTRFEGGVSCLWIATAILVAVLASSPRNRWPLPIAACAIASVLATGLWGFGWQGAIPFALINMAEAAIGASLFQRIDDRDRAPFSSFGWFLRIVGAVGVVAPLTAGVPAALAAYWLGQPIISSFANFVAGHALGAVTITPLCLFVSCPAARRESVLAIRKRWPSFLLSMAGFTAISLFVFSRDTLPLSFLTILSLILITLWQGREATALGVVILALVGGVATAAGHGPFQLLDAAPAARIMFLQFYLAATVLTVLPIAANLHARKRLMRDLTLSEQRFRMLAEQASDVLMQLGPLGEILYVSPSIRQLGSHDPDRLIGQNAALLIAPEHHERVAKTHFETLAHPGTTRSVDYLAVAADGSTRWFETRARALVDDDGRVEGTLSVVRDISARKAVEQQLTQAALTDPLTGLPNRRAFFEAGEQCVRRDPPAGPDCIAMFDVDHFKRVNDRFGHDGGDAFLRHLADIARRLLREEDLFARLGGEEFALLMRNTDIGQAMKVCDQLRGEIGRTPMTTERGSIQVTVSGGVAMLDERGLDHALRIADLALYEAKAGGRDQLALAA